MRRKLFLEARADTTFPLIILFGVLLAWMMAFLFITLYGQQMEARVDEQANALVNELARTASISLSGVQPPLDLPRDLGGSTYKIEVQDNNTFVVEITGGRRAGSVYNAVANVTVAVENKDFSPGGRVYFMRSGDWVIVSASPIEAPIENIAPVPTGEPPQFYHFAKENQREAAAIGAAYFEARERYPGENVDVSTYRWEGADSLLAQVTSDGAPLATLRITGSENGVNVGKVDNAWIVETVENADEIGAATACPSPENAYLGGWLYSPAKALNHLRSRTWRRVVDNVIDNVIVAVPVDAEIRAAAVTTNVWAYPTWRVTFGGYVLFYQMMPWYYEENIPGFVFQSVPELFPIV